MNTSHKHAKEIKAWADGFTIQFWHTTINEWVDAQRPSWNLDIIYRVKPEQLVRYGKFDFRAVPAFPTVAFVPKEFHTDYIVELFINPQKDSNLKLTFESNEGIWSLSKIELYNDKTSIGCS